MQNKIITVVGITVLFLGTCITPSVAIDTDNPEKYDYLKVNWRNRFLFVTMIIKNHLNRPVYNVKWELYVGPSLGLVLYPGVEQQPIKGNQEILKPLGQIRIRTGVVGFGFLSYYLKVVYDDYWATVTLDKIHYSANIGPFILWLGPFPF